MSLCGLKPFNDFLLHIKKKQKQKPKLDSLIHMVLSDPVAGYFLSSSSFLPYCALVPLDYLRDTKACQHFSKCRTLG